MSKSRGRHTTISPNIQQRWTEKNHQNEDQLHKLRISMTANQIVNNRQMQIAKQNIKGEQNHQYQNAFEPPATKNVTKRREVPQYLLGQKKIITNATPPQINANYNPPQQFVKNQSKTPDRHSTSPKPAEITYLMKRTKPVK